MHDFHQVRLLTHHLVDILVCGRRFLDCVFDFGATKNDVPHLVFEFLL